MPLHNLFKRREDAGCFAPCLQNAFSGGAIQKGAYLVAEAFQAFIQIDIHKTLCFFGIYFLVKAAIRSCMSGP